MKKKEPFYIPDMGISYPEKPDEHLHARTGGSVFTIDKNYPFWDRSFAFRWKSGWLYTGIFTLVFLLNRLRFALKIKGRSVLKKHKELFKNGALTVSNHIHRWDLLMALQAVRYRKLYFPAWKENLSGPDRSLIRLAGGIPVPTDIHTIKYFNQAFDALHEKRKWMHVFPESANWHYYPYIRPFKKGMFSLAYKYNIPVLPMAFSFRPPSGIYKVMNALLKQRKKKTGGGGGLCLITLSIGEPIMPDRALPRKEAVALLRKQCHESMVALAGIENNPWRPEGD
ncbi:MAG: 1-acyl-sn-glycerol-3-phosphate acyltransferase [Treponema sp.]|jgi:1-acyl-sn-glycerol-3-phosphate acyltransferase|nr:1-acyl-sn-glycerol-3-phosphate acyltransferase [Treponema sp.]